MNWKRGTFRIYVVAWCLFASLCAYLAYEQSSNGSYYRQVLSSFLNAYPNVTFKQVQTGEARRILAAEDAKNRALAESLGQLPTRGPTEFKGSSLDLAEAAASSDEILHPWQAYARVWLPWMFIGLVIPALILMMANWIINGFQAKSATQRVN